MKREQTLYDFNTFSSVQSLGHVPTVTPWTAARQASLSITNSQSLLKLMFIESETEAQENNRIGNAVINKKIIVKAMILHETAHRKHELRNELRIEPLGKRKGR